MEESGLNKIYTLVNADRPYRFLIEQMKEGAVTLSEDGIVLYGNRRLGEILGTPLEQVIGSDIRRFFSNEEWPRFEALLTGAGPEPSGAEFSVQRPLQAAVSIYVSVNGLVSDEGAPRLFGGVVTDLTEQHEMEARLSQAQKMEAIGQLTGGLAHDFNNLLQAICGNLELIKMQPQEPGNVKRWAENGLKAAGRGAKLTSQLLAFSRTQKINLLPVDAAELIWGMSDLLLRTLGSDIRIDYKLDESGACVLADKTQLELAVLNMAINARDAMPAGGTLRISTRLREMTDGLDLTPGEYLELSVSDSGKGMSEHVRARAFDPFFTTKKVGEGTGLGLAQVYGIARQAGGSARIVSSLGEGTTISVWLRRSAIPAAAIHGDVPHSRSRTAKSAVKVLIVDDDDDIRLILTEGLVAAGYEVSQAGSGTVGLDMMARSLPDVLLTDYSMPLMSGAELVKRARARGFDMPVIFATGYADTAALNDAIDFKPHILAKPFSLEALMQAIEIAVELKTPLPRQA